MATICSLASVGWLDWHGELSAWLASSRWAKSQKGLGSEHCNFKVQANSPATCWHYPLSLLALPACFRGISKQSPNPKTNTSTQQVMNMLMLSRWAHPGTRKTCYSAQKHMHQWMSSNRNGPIRGIMRCKMSISVTPKSSENTLP